MEETRDSLQAFLLGTRAKFVFPIFDKVVEIVKRLVILRHSGGRGWVNWQGCEGLLKSLRACDTMRQCAYLW
jgi:hypothetical protein